MPGMTYASTGVNYEGLDPFKIAAQKAAAQTDLYAKHLGVEIIEWTRGESVFVVSLNGVLVGFTIEGLGTKNLVADRIRDLLLILHQLARYPNATYYESLAQCCVAMIVNDMITLNIHPAVIGMHPAVASDVWFSDRARAADLVEGWRKACELSRCVWGPGETPALRDVIVPGTVALSGAGWGVSKGPLFDPENITHGDKIMGCGSNGVHANGLTLARTIGERKDSRVRRFLHRLFPKRFPLRATPNGYLSKLSDGRLYGEALLDPTHIYVGFAADCVDAGVDIHYGVNITGHGWRKLMRAPGKFAYVIKTVPWPQPVFHFIQKYGPVSDEEAYGNLNMGMGFALYMPPESVPLALKVWEKGKYPFSFFEAGDIVSSQRKKVTIQPLGLEWCGDSLAVR